MEKEVVATAQAPAALGPYSQAIVAQGFVFASGQIAMSPSTGELVGDDVAAQTRQAITNLSAVLRAAGSNLERLVKTNVYLRDMDTFAEFNRVYQEMIPSPYPARATVEVGKMPKGALIEIEAVALV